MEVDIVVGNEKWINFGHKKNENELRQMFNGGDTEIRTVMMATMTPPRMKLYLLSNLNRSSDPGHEFPVLVSDMSIFVLFSEINSLLHFTPGLNLQSLSLNFIFRAASSTFVNKRNITDILTVGFKKEIKENFPQAPDCHFDLIFRRFAKIRLNFEGDFLDSHLQTRQKKDIENAAHGSKTSKGVDL